MVGPFSIDTYLPAFPSIETDLTISRHVLSQTLAVYLAAFAVMTLIWGPISDRFGRKLVLLISSVMYALSSFGCATSTNIEGLLLFRILQGMAASGGYVAGRAMIRDAFSQQDARKVMSQVMMLFALAPAVAPLIGSVLHDFFGWRSIFYFLLLYGTVSFLLVWLRVSETHAEEHRQSLHPQHVIATYSREIKHLRFMMLLMSVTLSFGGLFIYIAGAPTVIFDFFDWQTKDFALFFIPITTGIMLGASVASKLAHRWSAEITTNRGFVLLLLASLLQIGLFLLQVTNPYLLIAPLVFYAFALSWLMPNIGILALDCFPKNRGSASAVQGSLQMMMNALIASLVVPFLSSSLLHFAAAQLLAVLLAFVLWRLLLLTPNNQQ